MSAVITRGKVTRADLANWDGKTATHTRLDASGGTVTGLAIGNEVDVLQIFGDGSSRSRTTIATALNHINSTPVTLVFAPGTWTIDDDLTIPSNFTCHIPCGCVFSVDSGKTLTFSGPVYSESSAFYSGSGTTALSVDSIVGGKPWIARTSVEIAASVTPTNYAYLISPYIDPRRYHSGTIGDATDDDAAVDQMILVIRQGGGTGIIPESFNSSMAVPALGLSNGQCGRIIDLRAERPNSGNNAFGSVDDYIEARDSSGNYASERRVLGKQNPAFTAVSLSDGTANGYSRTNFASSFLHKHEDQDQWQMLADPLFAGTYSWSLVYFAGSTGKTAMYVSVDSNSKPRFTLAQANLAAATGNISGATNATPIVITTSAPHGLDGVNQPVTIASVGGNTAANGDWEVTVLTSDTFSLNGSVGNGAYTSGGTFSGQQGHSRATLNVPKVQGGTEAIYTEGSIVSELAHGTAPISVQSKTVDTNLHARPYLVDASGAQQVGATPGVGSCKEAVGRVTLVAGAATVNLTNDAGFTSNATYNVFLQPYAGGSAATPTLVSGSQFTIAGTGTDTIAYRAVGH